jgi:hypothetical protein
MTLRDPAVRRRSMMRRSGPRRWSHRRPSWMSRIGRPGCWPASSVPGRPPSRGPGAVTGSSRGDGRRSSFSTDPELEAKVRDIVGLYLNPPGKAIVLCVDEKA